MAGTGPMPQLRQTMVPPGDTIWWSSPPSAPPQGPPGPGYRGSVPPAPVPRGYAPHGAVQPTPGQPTPGQPTPMPGLPAAVPSHPPAPATKPLAGPVVGAIALGLGIVLLIIGAASHVAIVVIGGLVAGAWGMWRLVTGIGNNAKPPGQT
jgi:hypothetical protein